MIRRIIEIDQDKCNGCGACSDACHEGAIAMVDGKAKLTTIAMALGIVSQSAPQAQSPLWSGRLQPMMKLLFWNRRKSRKKSCPAAAPAPPQKLSGGRISRRKPVCTGSPSCVNGRFRSSWFR